MQWLSFIILLNRALHASTVLLHFVLLLLYPAMYCIQALQQNNHVKVDGTNVAPPPRIMLYNTGFLLFKKTVYEHSCTKPYFRTRALQLGSSYPNSAQTACTLEGIQGRALYYQAGAQVGRGRPCPGTHDNAHEWLKAHTWFPQTSKAEEHSSRRSFCSSVLRQIPGDALSRQAGPTEQVSWYRVHRISSEWLHSSTRSCLQTRGSSWIPCFSYGFHNRSHIFNFIMKPEHFTCLTWNSYILLEQGTCL